MAKVKFPYGQTFMEADIPDSRLVGILSRDAYTAPATRKAEDIVREALENPIGTPKLRDMAKGKKNVVILCSDQTRAVPSKAFIPALLKEIRTGNPDADITLLIAGGNHVQINEEQLINKFGEDIVKNEKIAIHSSTEGNVEIGVLPSGGPLEIDKIAYEADLLVSEGLIEPHCFAGFSGSRKSIVPGISSRRTIFANHCSENVAHPKSHTAVFEGNPMHNDMLYAARAARLDFILNAVVNSSKELVHAVAGDAWFAHKAGCDIVLEERSVEKVNADIVITSNGGYPLDQNVYQAVKSMTAAEPCVNKGGVIIVINRAQNGHGGESFYNTFKNDPSLEHMMEVFLATPRDKTILDQWQSQTYVRIMLKANVIFVSDAPDQMIRDFHMTPAHSVEEALAIADKMLGREGSILCIPSGASVIVKE